jgi:hypothetical protein
MRLAEITLDTQKEVAALELSVELSKLRLPDGAMVVPNPQRFPLGELQEAALRYICEGSMTTTDHALVEQHAANLEAIARQMDRDGIGGHPTRGHAVVPRHMAACMRADAAVGETVHEFGGAAPWTGAPSPRLSY